MRVIFYATLRQVVGGRVVEIDGTQERTVQGLLDELIARYPALGPHLVDEQGNLWRHVHVMVNGRDAPYLEYGLDTRLQPGDTLDIFPPVGGGSWAVMPGLPALQYTQ
jgi:sulfur-carrier protein